MVLPKGFLLSSIIINVRRMEKHWWQKSWFIRFILAVLRIAMEMALEIEKLDYLETLGIGAIWLSPVINH